MTLSMYQTVIALAVVIAVTVLVYGGQLSAEIVGPLFGGLLGYVFGVGVKASNGAAANGAAMFAEPKHRR